MAINLSNYADGVKAKYEDPNVQNRYSDRTLLGEISCSTTQR